LTHTPGPKTCRRVIPYWAGVAADPTTRNTAGRKFTDTHKVVFTKTLHKPEWNNTVLAKGDLTEEITRLKKQDGQDLIVYGGATFVSALISGGLIDELPPVCKPRGHREWNVHFRRG
jgi:dihydrofolate reductase